MRGVEHIGGLSLLRPTKLRKAIPAIEFSLHRLERRLINSFLRFVVLIFASSSASTASFWLSACLRRLRSALEDEVNSEVGVSRAGFVAFEMLSFSFT